MSARRMPSSGWHNCCLPLSESSSEVIAMYVSNVGAAQTPFQFRSARSTQDVLQSSTPDDLGAARASSGQSGSYDFSSLTPEAFTKNVNDLFNAGKISKDEVQSASSLALLLPGGRVPLDPIQLNSTQNSAPPTNFLEKLRQKIAVDGHSGYAAPGQVQAEQSLLNVLTALQGKPKGVDKLA
jgi:hypothetical protein